MKDRSYRKPLLPENAARVFEGKIFDVYHFEQELYDGSSATFEKLSRPDTAIVFPVTEDGRVLIIEDSQPHRETMLTAISGRIEEGETPEEAAKRELLEETGYEATLWQPFYTIIPTEKLDWMNYVFIAKGAKKVTDAKPDAGEKIAVQSVTFDGLINLAAEGKLRGKDFTILVLQAKLDSQKMEELKKKFTP